MDSLVLQFPSVNTTADGEMQTDITCLVKAAKRGDQEAMIDLCRTIVKDIIFRAKIIMYNEMDAEDVAQETLIRVCKNIKTLKDPKAFNAWLCRIVINESRRYLSKNSKHTSALRIEDYFGEDIKDENESTMTDIILQEEDRKAVMEVVRMLPERQKEAVVLHYYNGLSVVEVSKVMETSHPNVSQLLKLARIKIRKELTRRSYIYEQSRAYGIAAIPLEPILSKVFEQEALAFASSNVAGVGKILGGCSKVIGSISSKSALGAGTLSGLGTTASKIAISIVAIAIGFSIGIHSLDAVDEEYVQMTGRIIYYGGNGESGHVNPAKALPDIDSEYGERIVNWIITPDGSDTVIYSGKGADADWALRKLSDDKESGNYVLHFIVEDGKGYIYSVSGSFLIREQT